MNKRCVLIFGQFGEAADPYNLPHLRDRLQAPLIGFECILIQHTDTQRAYNFLHGFDGRRTMVGSSLGAGAGPIIAGYLSDTIDFLGGFQPSVWDPVMTQGNPPYVTVPKNVTNALVFRNPAWTETGGLGWATWHKASSQTALTIVERHDPHPGDMPPAQDEMFDRIVGTK